MFCSPSKTSESGLLSVCVCLSVLVSAVAELSCLLEASCFVGDVLVRAVVIVSLGRDVLVAEKARFSSSISDSYLGVSWKVPVCACWAALSAKKLPG